MNNKQLLKSKKSAIVVPFAILALIAILLIGFVLAGATIIWLILRNFLIAFVVAFIGRLGLSRMRRKGLKSR